MLFFEESCTWWGPLLLWPISFKSCVQSRLLWEVTRDTVTFLSCKRLFHCFLKSTQPKTNWIFHPFKPVSGCELRIQYIICPLNFQTRSSNHLSNTTIIPCYIFLIFFFSLSGSWLDIYQVIFSQSRYWNEQLIIFVWKCLWLCVSHGSNKTFICSSMRIFWGAVLQKFLQIKCRCSDKVLPQDGDQLKLWPQTGHGVKRFC